MGTAPVLHVTHIYFNLHRPDVTMKWTEICVHCLTYILNIYSHRKSKGSKLCFNLPEIDTGSG